MQKGGEPVHNQVLRDEEYLARLKATIKTRYGITPIEITPAKRGYYGETWKLKGTAGCYFLKMDYLPYHQKKFQNSLAVIDYLCENGIDFVGQIVKTTDGKLYAPFETAVMGLFDWVEGENVETDATKIPEYQMLSKIYALTKPGFDIPVATFSDDAAVQFFQQWETLKALPQTPANRAMLSVFERFRDDLFHCASRLSQFAQRCRESKGPLYLTNGDAGVNFFIANGRNYIFDWDEVMYAPLERDAWVMGCYDWARKLFNNTLRENGIAYKLRPERLAFYCYHMYFFYLGGFLMVHPISDKSERAKDYFEDGWIKSRIAFADSIDPSL